MSAFTFVLRFLVTIIITIATVVAPTKMSEATAPNAPLDKENCKLNFAVISDIHAKTGIEGLPNDLVLNLFMKDFENADERYDSIFFVGDNTDHGYEEQWVHLYNQMKGHDLADNMYFAVGNHDTWTRDESEKTSSKGMFMIYNTKITGKLTLNQYYSVKVNGYPFIVLAGEGDGTDMYISNKQIKWLKSEMKKAAKLDKPIFVICHWPINMTHGLPVSWGDDDYDDMTGGIGEQSAKVNKILQKYKNVVYISGHIHNGLSNADTKAKLGYESLEKVGNIYSLNIPAINGFNENGDWFPGSSYAIEVYDDEIVLRARNFMTGLWRPEYNYIIPLS
ncbi:MAG: metallophosphoesterase [Clostridia bacterium]|nr:metallophosphoesterase [Clostridia bacterium]